MRASTLATVLAAAFTLSGAFADTIPSNFSYDIDALVERKLIPADGQKHLPNNSSLYTSTLGERHAAD